MLILRRFKRGITLIEVLIGITIIIVGILGVAKMFQIAIRVVHDAQATTLATQFALNQLEYITAVPYEEITSGAYETRHGITDNGTPNGFERQTLVTLVDQNMNTTTIDIGLKKVATTVFWNSIFGNEKSIRIYVLKSRF